MATQREMEQYDVRIVGRNIKRGRLPRNDYDKYLKNLPDVADKAVEIEEQQPLEPKGAPTEG
ncbi:MAG: hypothetical protein RBU30_05630 [Polyangia bacterium]|jgi:hypothetical protein|nr:hypothetical protein [Polyangia bacterium]